MKIIAILVVRDEEDIIEFSLSRFSEQFDYVYVYDTGSADSTWEIVLELSRERSNIIPVRSSKVLFSDGIRGFVWETARQKLNAGDWFARVDADEVYHIAPRTFVSSCVKRFESVVYCQYYDFQPISDELPEKASVPDLDLETRLRHYRVSPFHGEPRLFKYRNSIHWYSGEAGPRDPGIIARRKIPVRHYPARSQQQLMKRTALRQIMFAENPAAWGRPRSHHWQLDFEAFLGKSHDSNLRFLKPAEEIEVVLRTDHIPPMQTGLRGLCTKFLHVSGLIQMKDRFRPTEKSVSWKPSPMPQVIMGRIVSEYKRISEEYG